MILVTLYNMNLRLLRNNLCYYRPGLAVLGIVGCVFALALFPCLGPRCISGIFGRTESHASWIEISCSILGLVALMLGIAIMNAQLIALEAKKGEGLKAYRKGRLVEAEFSFRKALQMTERLAPDDPSRGDVLEHLTGVTHAQGNYDDAETFAQQWVGAQETSWGAEHPRTIHAMEELANIYDEIARYTLALPLLEKTLRVREARQAKEPAEFARCLSSMGNVW